MPAETLGKVTERSLNILPRPLCTVYLSKAVALFQNDTRHLILKKRQDLLLSLMSGKYNFNKEVNWYNIGSNEPITKVLTNNEQIDNWPSFEFFSCQVLFK